MRRWLGPLLLVGSILAVLGLVFRSADSARHVPPTQGAEEPVAPDSVVAVADREPATPEQDDATRRALLGSAADQETIAHAEYVFYGRVIEAETGHPLAASVEALTAYGGSVTRTKANDEGLFRLALDTERAGVLVRHGDFAAAVAEVSGENATPENAALVRLSLAARLLARITDRRGGRRAALELRVQADPYALRGPGQPFWWTTSWLDLTWSDGVDDFGRAVVGGLPAGVPLHVDIYEGSERIRRESEPIVLGIGEERELTIELRTGCRIHGVASEVDGTPAAGLAVWLLPADEVTFVKYFAAVERRDTLDRSETDAAGRFAFESVEPGTWWVGPAPRLFTGARVSPDDPAPLAQRVSVTAGEMQAEVFLDVHRGLTIQGRVVGWEAEPVSRARVWARAAGLLVEAQGGEFQLGPLAPGQYELTGSFPNAGANSEPVRALAGDREVVLSLRRGGGIAGSVHGPDGYPTKAVVDLVPADPTNAGFTRRRGGGQDDGGFAFNALVPGIYHLCAHDENGNVGRREQVVVEAGVVSTAFVVKLAPGATIEARLPPSEAGPPIGFRTVQSDVEMGVAFPPLRILSVLPGRVTVELVSYDPRTQALELLHSLEVDAVAGQTTEVDFASGEDG